MSIQVRPGYINPLSTMVSKKQEHIFLGKNTPADKAAELQTKQQQLQNTLLLMKSTGTDPGGSTVEQQEKLQAELEKVSEELKTVKNDIPQAAISSSAETMQTNFATPSHTKPRVDIYEKSVKEISAPGIYQLQHEENSKYHISFIPYSE